MSAFVQGHCEARFEPLRQLFGELLATGEELGASLAVTVEGEFAVDLWGGWADEGRKAAWGRDTLTHVWSTTKTMVALSALHLASRGELDLDQRVAHYWPEFGAAGKGAVRVRHLLSHSSGVSGWQQPVAIADLCDWERSTELLAAQEPWWEPGTASGYHALNYGHLVGEVTRRVSGMKPGAYLLAELAGPLGADFHIGLTPAVAARVSRIVPPPPAPIDPALIPPGSIAFKTLTNPAPDPTVSWQDDWCAADIGAANGHGNARSVARLQSILACGGELAGRRWLAPELVARVFETQTLGPDRVLGLPLHLGLGYGLPLPAVLPFVPEGRVAFWGGWGGSMVLVDAQRRLCFAYMMNKMAPDLIGGPNVARLATALYAALGA